MIAAHSAPIRFTKVQPSCRTTRRGRERGGEEEEVELGEGARLNSDWTRHGGSALVKLDLT